MSERANRSVVLALSDGDRTGVIRRMLEGYHIAAISDDGAEALRRVDQVMPEFLIFDMVLKRLDGIELIKRVRDLDAFVRPYAVAIAVRGCPLFEEAVKEAGACRVLFYPLEQASLRAALDGVRLMDRLPVDSSQLKALRAILLRLGFKPTTYGAKYLERAVQMALMDGRLVEHMTTQMYPLIAGEFQTDADKVDHAIRRAIENAWSSGSIEEQYRLFGNTIDDKRGKPTTSEMIALVANLLRVKEF